MSATVSFEVRKEIKEKMEKYKDVINWNEELRKFVERKIKEIEAQDKFKTIIKVLEEANWGVEEGFGVKSVREDRDERSWLFGPHILLLEGTELEGAE